LYRGTKRAYQLIDSTNVIDNVRHGGQTEVIPANESQTRPLARLEADQQREAFLYNFTTYFFIYSFYY